MENSLSEETTSAGHRISKLALRERKWLTTRQRKRRERKEHRMPSPEFSDWEAIRESDPSEDWEGVNLVRHFNCALLTEEDQKKESGAKRLLTLLSGRLINSQGVNSPEMVSSGEGVPRKKDPAAALNPKLRRNGAGESDRP